MAASVTKVQQAVAFYVNGLHTRHRRRWVLISLEHSNGSGRLLQSDQRVREWLGQLDSPSPRLCPPVNGDYLPELSRFARTLCHCCACSQECRRITCCLTRWRRLRDPLHGWLSGLWLALSETPSFRCLAQRDSRIDAWVSSSCPGDAPPIIDEIVPPLDLRDLRAIRRALNRLRMQDVRASRPEPRQLDRLAKPSTQRLDEFLFEDGLGPAWDDVKDERLRFAVAGLNEQDRAMLFLKHSSLKQKEIAELVGLSEARVSQRLARILDELAKNIRGAND